MAWRGLGDAIKWFTGLFGVKPCEACEKRRRRLNRLVPFRRLSMHEKMDRAHAKLWKKPRITDTDSAALHMKYRKVIDGFFKEFGQSFHKLRTEGTAAFHVLYIEDEILHCALVPTKIHGGFSISRKERRLLKKQIERDILVKTQFKKVKWHVS